MKSFKSFLMSEGDFGISKNKETQFHAKLDKLVHKTFGKRKDESLVKEDGMVASAGPTNAVSSGAIAGTGGKGGEPGVKLSKKKKYEASSDPRLMTMSKRNPPKM